MYVSTFNPNQAVALSQGYQSNASAFPVSIRPSLQGNTVTYAFNPALSSVAWPVNPTLAAGTMGINPAIFPHQAALGGAGMTMNPFLAQSLAYNPAITTGFIPGFGGFYNPAIAQAYTAPFLTGQMPLHTIQSSAGMAQMRVDLHETNSDVVVACELPNVSLNDLSLTVTDDSLSICAIAWAGNRPTSLFRTVALPTSIRSEQVEATYSNGILEIRAPKSDIATRRRVKINVAQ